MSKTAKGARTTRPASNGRPKKAAPAETVHVTFLVDRSGSMESIRSDVIGGFNHFLHEQQKQDGECRLTVHQFDSEGFETLLRGMDVDDVRDATDLDFEPRGATPLFDAIGRAITQAQIWVDVAGNENEQPIFVILTDGLENASREYSAPEIFKLITAKEQQGWVFTYLGANQDAYATADAIGIKPEATQNYIADAVGADAAFKSVTDAVSESRTHVRAGRKVTSTNLYENTGKGADADHLARTGAPKRPAKKKPWTKS